MIETKKLARIGADALPIYRAYAGNRTAKLLANEMHNPEDRTWAFAGRVLLDASTDKVDGWLASHAGPTWYGGYLDQLADKYWYLKIANQLVKNGEINEALLKLTIARDVATTVARPVAELFGLESDANIWGKAKMAAQIGATAASCSPLSSEHPDFVHSLHAFAAGASAVSGIQMLTGYGKEISKQYSHEPSAQFIVATTAHLELLSV